jgi:hypothetical protein
MGKFTTILVPAIVLAMLAAPRPAAAICSITEQFFPADGDTVPANLRSIWFQSEKRITRIVGPNGNVAVGMPRYHSQLSELAIIDALQPNSDYTIELTDGLDQITQLTFHTASIDDTVAPPEPLLEELQAEAIPYGPGQLGENYGDGYFFLGANVSNFATATIFEITIGQRGQPAQQAYVKANANVGASSNVCGGVVANVPGGQVACITVVAIDDAGNRSLATTSCVTVRDCAAPEQGAGSTGDRFTCFPKQGCSASNSSNVAVAVGLLSLCAFIRRRTIMKPKRDIANRDSNASTS